MSFLSLAFLAALPLAAAPLLLHLFDRRRNVAIDWGAMQFLVEAATRRTRARRFQHWLLLVLRVLCVAALVLALARPLAQSRWLGASDRQEVILVIDNSLSTQRRSQTGDDSGRKVVFDELLSRAEETITALGPGNVVRMLVTSPYPAWVTPASLRLNSTTREDLIELLHELRATQGTSDIPAALLKAVQSNLEDQRLVGRRVVLLTDGQRNDWHTDDSEAWARFNTALYKSPVPTTLQVIETGTSQPVVANLAVTRLRTNRAVAGVNHSLAITGEVCNFASGGTQACPVTWYIDQQKISASDLLPLARGEKRDVTLKHSFSKPGLDVRSEGRRVGKVG